MCQRRAHESARASEQCVCSRPKLTRVTHTTWCRGPWTRSPRAFIPVSAPPPAHRVTACPAGAPPRPRDVLTAVSAIAGRYRTTCIVRRFKKRLVSLPHYSSPLDAPVPTKYADSTQRPCHVLHVYRRACRHARGRAGPRGPRVAARPPRPDDGARHACVEPTPI